MKWLQFSILMIVFYYFLTDQYTYIKLKEHEIAVTYEALYCLKMVTRFNYNKAIYI